VKAYSSCGYSRLSRRVTGGPSSDHANRAGSPQRAKRIQLNSLPNPSMVAEKSSVRHVPARKCVSSHSAGPKRQSSDHARPRAHHISQRSLSAHARSVPRWSRTEDEPHPRSVHLEAISILLTVRGDNIRQEFCEICLYACVFLSHRRRDQVVRGSKRLNLARQNRCHPFLVGGVWRGRAHHGSYHREEVLHPMVKLTQQKPPAVFSYSPIGDLNRRANEARDQTVWLLPRKPHARLTSL
jgi:hypothetical protein